ncbi:MAG: hypothetical protein WBV10_00055 [Exiguobacterium marinum]|uniref:hypothetical protein n=1 Tax=Exiguobacterium marinum TaxID=273528 RepID=UPI003C3F8B9D
MKKITLYLLTVFLIFSTFSVQAATELRSSLPIASASDAGERLLTTGDDVLPGETSSRTYTYTMLGDEKAASSKYVSVDWAHSELLIPPSALTVDIDGEPLKSVALSKESSQGNIRVPLQNEHLTKGTHEVTVRFTGVIEGRMCDTGNTSGSWLTVLPSSFLSIGSKVELALNDYPNPFIQTTNQKLTIVLPDSPDTMSLEAGLLLFRQLQGDATDSNNVSLQYEGQLKSWDGRYIFVGQTDSFTGPVLALIEELRTLPEGEKVLFEQARIVNNETAVDAMFVLAEDSASFEGTVDHLLISTQRQQLNGSQLALSSTPSVQKSGDTIDLRTLGASDFMLSGTQAVSQNYFYPLPVIDRQSTVEMDVRFKTSAYVTSEQNNDVSPELIAWVNGTPHSIPLSPLEDDQEWQQHTIQIDASTLQKDTFLDVSFEANGLRSEAPCNESDLDRWIFISSDSQLTLPKGSGEANNKVFSNMASLFSTDPGVVFVIPDESNAQTLQNMVGVMSGLPVTPLTQQVEFIRANDVTEDVLSNRSIIYIGDPEQSPLFNEQKEDWLVTKDNQVDLSQYGFVPETSSEYAWIQPSPWNEDKAMIVVSTNDTIDSTLIQTLAFPSETFSVAVKNQNGAVFTNSASIQSEQAEGDVTSNESTSMNPTWYFVGFIALIALIVAILFYLRRNKKK